MSDKEKIFEKWYKTLSWIMDKVETFPRKSKFTLGERILNISFYILEKLIEAYYKKDKKQDLYEVNLSLEKLRLLFRLSYEKKYISVTQYGYISENINETGRIVGAWLKKT